MIRYTLYIDFGNGYEEIDRNRDYSIWIENLSKIDFNKVLITQYKDNAEIPFFFSFKNQWERIKELEGDDVLVIQRERKLKNKL